MVYNGKNGLTYLIGHGLGIYTVYVFHCTLEYTTNMSLLGRYLLDLNTYMHVNPMKKMFFQGP